MSGKGQEVVLVTLGTMEAGNQNSISGQVGKDVVMSLKPIDQQ